MIARSAGIGDDMEVAERAAEAVLSAASTTVGLAADVGVGLALLAVHRGDAAGAREHYSGLGSSRRYMLFASIAGDRLLGPLAQTMGAHDDATSHFDDAIALCRNAGYRPELAWTCCDYADTLLHRDAEGDRSKAMSCWTNPWPSPARWA